MRAKLINKGQANPAPTHGRGYLTLFTAILALALAFVFNACGGDNGSEPNVSSSSGISSSSGGGSSPSNGSSSSSSTNTSSSSSSSLSSSSDASSVPCTAENNTDTQYCSNGTMRNYGSVSDSNGKSYKTILIGAQTWMAENLDYDGGDGSKGKCYENNTANCDKYGRLYDWETAMNEAPSSTTNPSGVQGICPSGWHLPSDTEWDALQLGTNLGTKLKAISGWNNDDDGESGNGTDNYGFKALPGGKFTSSAFRNVGEEGIWWTSSEKDATYAWERSLYSYSKSFSFGDCGKGCLLSVRCVKNYVSFP